MNKWSRNLITIATAAGLGLSAFGVSTVVMAESQKPARVKKVRNEKGRSPERLQEMMAKRHAELHGKLKLNASQEAAWKDYTAATEKNMTPPTGQERPNFEAMTAPQRMEKAIEMSRLRQSRMESQLAALKTFYARLTPEQQKIFDAETSPRKFRGKGRDGMKRPMSE